MHRPIRAIALVAALACSSTKGPPLTSLTPATGTAGTLVTIAGSGFVQTPKVTFIPVGGGNAVDGVVHDFTLTSLDVNVPDAGARNADGTVFDVRVTNPDGGATTLAKAFTMTGPTVSDINGGLAGSGTVGSLFILDGNHFGDLAAAPASGYSVDFRDSTTNAVVASAAVDFANSDWQDIFIVGTVPGTLGSSTTYKVTVTTPSGTSAPLNFLVTGAVSFSPATIQWTATSNLPAAVQGLSAVIANSYLYALGGNSGAKTANLSTVSFNPVTPATGALANPSWTAATPLPDKRGFAAAVSANSFNSIVTGNGNLYVIGGLDGAGAATSTVYTAALNPDGSLPAAAAPGTWGTTTALPQALFGESAVIFHGRIYVAGGNDSTGAPSAKVYSAHIKGDGSLDAWQTLPDLPAAVAYHQLVTSGGYLYVLGGTNASSIDPVSKTQSSASSGSIYDAPINIRTGGISAWTANASSMGKSREKFSAVVAGSFVLISGGLYAGATTGSSEQSYASINSDGSISSFNGATGSHTISGSAGGYDFFNHAAVLFVDSAGNPHVIVIGGEDTNAGTPVAGVWYQH
ncbi:MAG: Kelch repeat-containing protein [Myxococcales bacterium]